MNIDQNNEYSVKTFEKALNIILKILMLNNNTKDFHSIINDINNIITTIKDDNVANLVLELISTTNDSDCECLRIINLIEKIYDIKKEKKENISSKIEQPYNPITLAYLEYLKNTANKYK